MEAGRSRQLDPWHIILVGAEGCIITNDFRILFRQVHLKLSGPEDTVDPAVSISVWPDGIIFGS